MVNIFYPSFLTFVLGAQEKYRHKKNIFNWSLLSGSSLIWVHSVCNIVFVRTYADKRSRRQNVVTGWKRLILLFPINLYILGCMSIDPDMGPYCLQYSLPKNISRFEGAAVADQEGVQGVCSNPPHLPHF